MFKKKHNANESLHTFITGGASTSKTFISMPSIQSLLCFYNKHPQLDLYKKKALLLAYIGKTTFNIDGTIIHSNLSIHFNYKDLSSLSS